MKKAVIVWQLFSKQDNYLWLRINKNPESSFQDPGRFDNVGDLLFN
ncbi:MAG TPA: hypothetical protein PK736_03375 [Bacteroidia bacterium]|nr:hypothetical protein [Bacteroidia bacterium]